MIVPPANFTPAITAEPRNDAPFANISYIPKYSPEFSAGMIFAKYDIHELERHSIMAEVKDFDYYNWYINIINFNLREPYKSIKRYD